MGDEKCPGCAKQIFVGAKFCPHCGLNLEIPSDPGIKRYQKCLKCNRQVPAEAKFCPYCRLELDNLFNQGGKRFRKCSPCGRHMLDTANICPYCGSFAESMSFICGGLAIISGIAYLFIKHC